MTGKSKKTGWWTDEAGRLQHVIELSDGGIYATGTDGSWTCASAETFDKWRSCGWRRVAGSAPSMGGGE